MRIIECAVCGKRIAKDEHRLVDRRRVSLLARLLRKGAPPEDVHVHPGCKPSSTLRPPAG